MVWFLTGAWHGASWNFILWGLYFGVILILEKMILLKVLQKLGPVIQHLYAIFLILISWVIFAFEDLGKIKDYFLALFAGGNTPLVNSEGLYYLTSYAGIILIGIFFSLPIFSKLFSKLENSNKKIAAFATTGFYIGILLLSTASLVSDAFNPFLYFRF